VDLLQHAGALLQTVQNVLLHERELDIRGQRLELRELRVRLCQQRFLVFLLSQREKGPWFIAVAKAFASDFFLAVREEDDFLLVLVQSVALVFHVEDRSWVG